MVNNTPLVEPKVNKTLKEIRRNFGFSQEELAHRIGVSLSTLSRWERQKTKEPVLSAISRKTNRRLQYVKALASPALLEQVQSSPAYTSLHYSNDLMLVECSHKYAQDYPGVPWLIGFPVRNLLLGKSKQHYWENFEQLTKALEIPGASAIWVTEDITTPAFVMRGKAMQAMVVEPGLLLVEGQDTTAQDLPTRLEVTFPAEK